MKFLLGVVLFLVSVSGPAQSSNQDIYRIANQILKANHLSPLKKLLIINSTEYNAMYVGNNTVVIYTGLLKNIPNKEQLAFVIAHEIGHRDRHDTRSTYKSELAADKLGFKYIQKAGFNMCKGAEFLRNLSGDANTHPDGKIRFAASGCV